MEYITISKARNQILGLARAPGSTTLTRNGEPVAVLSPIREYRAIQALVKLAANPEQFAQVMSAHQLVQEGQLDDFVELESHDTAAVHEDIY